MQPDVNAFLERFRAFGSAPSVETYLPLFHPEATLFDSGMAEPIGVDAIPEHIEAILELVPDFRMTPERWRCRGATLFVEARNAATLGQHAARWRSVYCVDLRGEQVIRGRRYYDRRALYSLLNPALPRLPDLDVGAEAAPPLAEPYAEVDDLADAWAAAWLAGRPGDVALLFREDGCLWSAGCERPLGRDAIAGHYRARGAILPEWTLEPTHWAGDESLLFTEWQATTRIGAATLRVGGCDRFDWAAGLVLAARSYFDTLEVATALAAEAQGP